MCKAYMTSYRLPIIITRGNNVYGPHQVGAPFQACSAKGPAECYTALYAAGCQSLVVCAHLLGGYTGLHC